MKRFLLCLLVLFALTAVCAAENVTWYCPDCQRVVVTRSCPTCGLTLGSDATESDPAWRIARVDYYDVYEDHEMMEEIESTEFYHYDNQGLLNEVIVDDYLAEETTTLRFDADKNPIQIIISDLDEQYIRCEDNCYIIDIPNFLYIEQTFYPDGSSFTQRFEYDANGNRVLVLENTKTVNCWRLLSSVTYGNSEIINEYVYNADGLPVYGYQYNPADPDSVIYPNSKITWEPVPQAETEESSTAQSLLKLLQNVLTAKPKTNEPPTAEEAAEKALKEMRTIWRSQGDGYFSVRSTRVIYIRQDIDQNEDSVAYQIFGDTVCLVEFVLYSDYLGSAPYYANYNINNWVALKQDGSLKVMNDPFAIYRNRTYRFDFSDIISSVVNLGDQFNTDEYLQ